MTSKSLAEDAVLKPRNPAIDTEPDDWPEFRLSDARADLPDEEASTVSLLQASENHPITVTGRLEPLPKPLAHLYCGTSTKRTTTIKVENVRGFAYGQYDDGSVALWAMGRAGWYAMKPARAYRAVYKDMIDAIKTLYFIADAYREPRRRLKGKRANALQAFTAQELFEKYATEVIGAPGAVAEGAQTIYKHRDFLLSSMIAGKEDLAWAKNPLYQHLCQKFPADLAAIKHRLAVSAKPSRQKSQRSRQASLQTTTSISSSLKRKRGRPLKDTSIDTLSLSPSSIAELKAKEVTPHPESARPKAPMASNVPQRKAASQRQTRQNQIAESTKSAAETSEATSTPPFEDSDEEDYIGLVHKGKSSLRPKSSKGSKGGKGRAPITEVESDQDEETKPPSSPTGSKRKFDEHSGGRQRKRKHSKHEVDEGIDIPDSPSASEDMTSPDEITVDVASDLALRTKHEPGPVQEDTWICALDGCMHKVYEASKMDSQRLIREHYKLHAYDEDERVQLVKKLQAPSLPVSHLIDRVRMQAKLEGFPGSKLAGSRFPQPVIQRS